MLIWVRFLLLKLELKVVFFFIFTLPGPLLSEVLLEGLFILVHVLLEFLAPASLKVKLRDDLVGDVGKVQEYHNHVRLLKEEALSFGIHIIICWFLVSIFNQFFSLLNIGGDVVEAV